MRYKGYLIDLDGTMYRGTAPIDGAGDFIETLQAQHIPYVFVTNNSSATEAMVVEKLARFGIDTTPDHVLTSATATAKYIARAQQGATCYIIGEKGLHEACEKAGLKKSASDADFVVMGIDREISYEKLKTAALHVRRGATFISTNKDAAIPTEEGLLPGNGSLTSVVSVSTGVAPIFVGKPEPIIMEEALRMIGLDRKEVLMVGDNYTTDILAGVHARMDTLMVLTGFSSREDVVGVPEAEKPTYIMDDLHVWRKEKMV
ncbi:TIGR01457 family HAD-type hydrolase [Pseudogracilibacillus sp. ICA-222130]|uniref:TIGR01457 family HAD-type hydrolase n=1 Tax=Pseudogracilibacillus sp. ICA-222130 TaxID=3134655 RepID=UPI004040705F